MMYYDNKYKGRSVTRMHVASWSYRYRDCHEECQDCPYDFMYKSQTMTNYNFKHIDCLHFCRICGTINLLANRILDQYPTKYHRVIILQETVCMHVLPCWSHTIVVLWCTRYPVSKTTQSFSYARTTGTTTPTALSWQSTIPTIAHLDSFNVQTALVFLLYSHVMVTHNAQTAVMNQVHCVQRKYINSYPHTFLTISTSGFCLLIVKVKWMMHVQRDLQKCHVLGT